MAFSINDRSLISSFFNEGGYILNFSDATFSQFTVGSIGFSIKDKYGLSKGRSFSEFAQTEGEGIVLKLVVDLLEYIERQELRLNESQKKLLPKLKSLVAQNSNTFSFSKNLIEDVAAQFDDAYIDNQMKIMSDLASSSPADVIGKSKELVESCFKHILDKNGKRYSNSDSLSNLQKSVFVLLNLDTKENISAKNNEDVKRILSSFNQIIQGLNSLRNDKGDGHGKSEGFKELPERYALLAMNSALTLVHFVWDTYKNKKKGKAL